MSEEMMISGGDSLRKDVGERILSVSGIEDIGKEWEEGNYKVKVLGRGVDGSEGREVKTYLECVNLQVKTAREIMSLKKGLGAGEGVGLLEALGIE